jgi:hypothetical protein
MLSELAQTVGEERKKNLLRVAVSIGVFLAKLIEWYLDFFVEQFVALQTDLLVLHASPNVEGAHTLSLSICFVVLKTRHMRTSSRFVSWGASSMVGM